MNTRLTLAVSSRALFELEQEHEIFVRDGPAKFEVNQVENEERPLAPGIAFNLVSKLLALNDLQQPNRCVEVVLLSRNSPNAGVRVMRSIQHYKLAIDRAIFTGGADRFRYAQALGAHLFLSVNVSDVKAALENGVAAAVMMPSNTVSPTFEPEVRIAFDGDAVLFSDEAERVHKLHGLEAFEVHEEERAALPLPAGPFKPFLKVLRQLQGQYPIKCGLFTARGLRVHERALRTLRDWGIAVDVAVFAGGMPKGPFLEAFGADVFFDDTPANCEGTSKVVSTGMVPSGISHE